MVKWIFIELLMLFRGALAFECIQQKLSVSASLPLSLQTPFLYLFWRITTNIHGENKESIHTGASLPNSYATTYCCPFILTVDSYLQFKQASYVSRLTILLKQKTASSVSNVFPCPPGLPLNSFRISFRALKMSIDNGSEDDSLQLSYFFRWNAFTRCLKVYK